MQDRRARPGPFPHFRTRAPSQGPRGGACGRVGRSLRGRRAVPVHGPHPGPRPPSGPGHPAHARAAPARSELRAGGHRAGRGAQDRGTAFGTPGRPESHHITHILAVVATAAGEEPRSCADGTRNLGGGAAATSLGVARRGAGTRRQWAWPGRLRGGLPGRGRRGAPELGPVGRVRRCAGAWQGTV